MAKIDYKKQAEDFEKSIKGDKVYLVAIGNQYYRVFDSNIMMEIGHRIPYNVRRLRKNNSLEFAVKSASGLSLRAELTNMLPSKNVIEL